MAVLQYVGARYVPKLFNDGQGGMEWKANTYYEPLTIVTYNNTSYISRGPVAASVGNPAVNGAYWAETGNYNAYFQVLSDRVARLESPTFLIISDSYGNTSSPTWLERIGAYLPGKTYTIAQPSAGFSSQCPISFVEAMERFSGDPNEIDHVIVCGGANDAYYSGNESSIISGLSSFISAAKTKFPYAKISIGEIGWSWAQDLSGQRGKVRFINTINAYKTASALGASYLNGVEYSLHRSDVFIGDNFHPNLKGQDYLLRWITEAVLTGSASVMYFETIPLTAVNGSLSAIMTQSLTDGEVKVTIRSTNLAHNPVINLTSNFEDVDVDTALQFATFATSLTDKAVFGKNGAYLTAQCQKLTAGSSDRHPSMENFYIYLEGGGLYIKPLHDYGKTINENGITAPEISWTCAALSC